MCDDWQAAQGVIACCKVGLAQAPHSHEQIKQYEKKWMDDNNVFQDPNVTFYKPLTTVQLFFSSDIEHSFKSQNCK